MRGWILTAVSAAALAACNAETGGEQGTYGPKPTEEGNAAEPSDSVTPNVVDRSSSSPDEQTPGAATGEMGQEQAPPMQAAQ